MIEALHDRLLGYSAFADWAAPSCPSVSPHAYFCTAGKGHDGPHTAHTAGGQLVVAVWFDDRVLWEEGYDAL